MAFKLLPHQIEDARKLAAGKDLPNYSEAGVGKTHATLEGIRLSKMQGGVIIAPSIALPMWKEEIENYLGASAEIIKTGKSPLRGSDFQILSYGLTVNVDLRARLLDRGGDVMVLDESHYLKSPTAKRTKAVFGPNCTGKGGLFNSYAQCWELTGTPILAHANDMWSQLRPIAGEVLRKHKVAEYDDFVKTFCVTQLRQFNPRMKPTRAVVASANDRLLNRLVYDEVGALRRTMAEVGSTMPPLTYRVVSVPIKRSAELNAAVKGKSVEALMAGLAGDDVVMAKAWRLLGELKVDGCIEYVLEQVKAGPVLVGYWHTATGDDVEKRLRDSGLTVARVQGSTPMATREEIRKSFNGGAIDVLVGQIASMNVSWNLQKCGNHVVILEDHFSPGIIEQFVKRVWRFGQENHVQCDFIKADNELDEAITRVREGKSAYNRKAIG